MSLADLLPKSIGGMYGFDRFVHGQELRMRYEWDLPAGAGHEEEANRLFDFSRVKPLTELTEEEKSDRKRKLSVIHSRRKRERERIRIEVLSEQCDEQRTEKEKLARENSRLKRLVKQALSTITGVGNDRACD